MSVPLWDFQSLGVAAIRDAFLRGRRAVIAASPTGSGKTVLACHIVEKIAGNGKRALFLAHRKELIDQVSRKLDDCGLDHGIVMSKHWRCRPWLPVQVASVPTLINRPTLPEAEMVILDECHHAVASSFHHILKAYPTARLLGLSATPYRADGRGLADVGYEEIVTIAQLGELIEQGYLVPPRTFAPDTPDLSGVRRVAGDFNGKDLGKAMDRPGLVGNVVDTWVKLAAGRTTVVFAVNVKHSQHLVERFVKAGIRAEHLDADTPTDVREAILARVQSGETTVVSNVAILTEGWDLPRASCVVMARPTLSEGLFLQMAGRVLRRDAGKADCLILDHANNSTRHGLVTDVRTFSLIGDRHTSGDEKKPPALKTCPRCFSVVPSAAEVCPGIQWDGSECRHRFEKKTRVIVERPGELRELRQAGRAAMPEERKAAVLAGLMAKARAAGHQEVAPLVIFKGMFGTWPDAGLRAQAERLAGERGAA